MYPPLKNCLSKQFIITIRFWCRRRSSTTSCGWTSGRSWLRQVLPFPATIRNPEYNKYKRYCADEGTSYNHCIPLSLFFFSVPFFVWFLLLVCIWCYKKMITLTAFYFPSILFVNIDNIIYSLLVLYIVMYAFYVPF